MSVFLKSFLFIALALPLTGHSSVHLIRTDSYDKIEEGIRAEFKGAPENVLLVFDIDKTLLLVTDCVDGSWFKKAHQCPYDPTEVSLKDRISQFQSEGYSSLVLTARGKSLIKPSLRELKRNEMIFSGFPFDESHDQELKIEKTKVQVRSGIIFANGKNKAQVLRAFLKSVDWKPTKLVFIDDNPKNIVDLTESFENDSKYQLLLFHYDRYLD